MSEQNDTRERVRLWMAKHRDVLPERVPERELIARLDQIEREEHKPSSLRLHLGLDPEAWVRRFDCELELLRLRIWRLRETLAQPESSRKEMAARALQFEEDLATLLGGSDSDRVAEALKREKREERSRKLLARQLAELEAELREREDA